MSIDPNTLPDGTVVETKDGYLHFKDGGGLQSNRGWLGDGHPHPWRGRTIVRTYMPDPTPDQEAPRDEWANIAVGSRVRIVEINGDEHTVTVDYACLAADVVWLYDEDHDYDGATIARVYLLDAPTPPDPDAEAVEVMARAFVPVPDGMTHDEAVAALADAGAWVEVETVDGLPHGARMRSNWRHGDPADDRTYVHRDDLPPTDPDADLIEAMARGIRAVKGYEDPWDNVVEDLRENYRVSARAALAALREHEAKS